MDVLLALAEMVNKGHSCTNTILKQRWRAVLFSVTADIEKAFTIGPTSLCSSNRWVTICAFPMGSFMKHCSY